MTMPTTEFLKKYAPDFMWCTVFDLYLMHEQINENNDWWCFRTTLSYLKRKGYFITQPSPVQSWKNGPRPLVYLRVK